MQISIRELKTNPSHAIGRMQAGERVQITSHRKVVAELVEPQTAVTSSSLMSDEEAMQKLLDSGLIAQPATKAFKLPTPLKMPASPKGQTLSELVLELRGPR